jgi:hypothetical protein
LVRIDSGDAAKLLKIMGGERGSDEEGKSGEYG